MIRAGQYWKLIPRLRAALCALPLFAVAIQTLAVCPPPSGVALQVLGSGGPIADDARASSSYLLWSEGKARVLIDMGWGALLRFAESGARFEDLDALLLTHLHVDHVADLPALLKSGYFSSRARPLPIVGPGGGGNRRVNFPPLTSYLKSLLDEKQGAYAYLSDYLDPGAGSVELQPIIVGSGTSPQTVISITDNDPGGGEYEEGHRETDQRLRATALRVSHGPVPAVAYRVVLDGHSVVFAGDQDGSSEEFVSFAAGADLLVVHMAVPENAGRAALALHAPPSRLGDIAAAAAPDQLLLSHLMARSLRDIDSNVRQVSARYKGTITVADDLDCIDLQHR